MPEDYYSLLGVDPDASEEAILRAYRSKAAEHHPDVNDDPGANDTFRRLNRAKQVLTDEDRRRSYDRLGHERFVDRFAGGDSPSGGSRSSGWETPDGSVTRRPRGSVFEALFGRAFDVPGTVGTARQRGWPGGPRPAVDLEAWFETARRRRPEGPAREADARPCPKCSGRGTIVHDIDTGRGRRRRLEPCERCGGDGSVPA